MIDTQTHISEFLRLEMCWLTSSDAFKVMLCEKGAKLGSSQIDCKQLIAADSRPQFLGAFLAHGFMRQLFSSLHIFAQHHTLASKIFGKPGEIRVKSPSSYLLCDDSLCVLLQNAASGVALCLVIIQTLWNEDVMYSLASYQPPSFNDPSLFFFTHWSTEKKFCHCELIQLFNDVQKTSQTGPISFDFQSVMSTHPDLFQLLSLLILCQITFPSVKSSYFAICSLAVLRLASEYRLCIISGPL